MRVAYTKRPCRNYESVVHSRAIGIRNSPRLPAVFPAIITGDGGAAPAASPKLMR
jgi:hypothetical protein